LATGHLRVSEERRCIVRLLGALFARMAEAEGELGRINAQAGDGDHGQSMVRGLGAAVDAARAAAVAGAGAASVLTAAGRAWADRPGGTSGALWGMALEAWAGCYRDVTGIDARTTAAGAQAALEAIQRVGGAMPGDKTWLTPSRLRAFLRRVDTGGPGGSLGMSAKCSVNCGSSCQNGMGACDSCTAAALATACSPSCIQRWMASFSAGLPATSERFGKWWPRPGSSVAAVLHVEHRPECDRGSGHPVLPLVSLDICATGSQ